MSLGRGSTAVVWMAAAAAFPILSPALHGQQLRSFLPQAPLAPTTRAGRFAMDNRKRDLISSDWVFAMPLFVWRGENWFRFRYRHFSSHLGD